MDLYRIKRYGLQVVLNGIQQFDVEFHVGLTEFNYEIDAKTGKILDSDIDIND